MTPRSRMPRSRIPRPKGDRRAYPEAGITAKYFGKILEQKGDMRGYPDVFKISSTAELCRVTSSHYLASSET